MKFFSKVLLGTILLTGCSKQERSEIEVVKYDDELVKTIRSQYDSMYLVGKKHTEFANNEHYLTKPATEKIIFKDSLGNIAAIVIREKNMNVFAQEYYPNGQAKGKTNFVDGSVDGLATYYYEDGRIRSKGRWAGHKQVGPWKDYDSDGYLTSIQYYDSAGLLEKEEIVKQATATKSDRP